MNPRYERREGEESYEYGLRLIETKIEQKPDDLDWEDIIEATGIDCHRDSLRKQLPLLRILGMLSHNISKRNMRCKMPRSRTSTWMN